MQTRAQPTAAAEPDLFPAAPASTELRLEFTGILSQDAQVRTKPVGDGIHALPVLCLELRDVGPLHQTLHAEQIYSEATRAQAEAHAKTLKRGAQVRLVTNALNMRLVLPHVEQVELSPSP